MKTEDKNDKFRRLAKARGNLVIRYLRLLGNLSNRNNYSYSAEEVRKIFDAIEEELKTTRSQFNFRKKREILF